MSLHACVGITF